MGGNRWDFKGRGGKIDEASSTQKKTLGKNRGNNELVNFALGEGL